MVAGQGYSSQGRGKAVRAEVTSRGTASMGGDGLVGSAPEPWEPGSAGP